MTLIFSNGTLPQLSLYTFDEGGYVRTEVNQITIDEYTPFGTSVITGSTGERYLYDLRAIVTVAQFDLLSAFTTWQRVQLRSRQPGVVTLLDKQSYSLTWPVGEAPRPLTDSITPYPGTVKGYESVSVLIELDPKQYKGNNNDGDCTFTLPFKLYER